MTHAPRNSTEADIQALDDLCDRLASFGADIALEWLDGALTAIVASRRQIPMDEWLEPLLGDAFERAHGDPESAAEARAVLDKRCGVLASQLDAESLVDDPEELRLAPLMVTYDDAARAEVVEAGHMSAEDAELMLQTGALWSEGFQAGVEALPEDWPEPDMETEEGRWYDECLARVYALGLPPDDLAEYLAEAYPDEKLERDQLVDEAAYAVQDLRVHWIDHAPKPETRRVAPTPGRNDPCPCGSGRKYKKCHGA